jgi:hypothetical protein
VARPFPAEAGLLDAAERGLHAAGVDLMKPFRPKFTDKTYVIW